MDEEKQHIERISQERGDFVTGEDGYVVFWPSENYGALTAYHLRYIADILDERNKEWHEEVQNYFESMAENSS